MPSFYKFDSTRTFERPVNKVIVERGPVRITRMMESNPNQNQIRTDYGTFQTGEVCEPGGAPVYVEPAPGSGSLRIVGVVFSDEVGVT